MKAQASKEFDHSVKAPALLYRKIMLEVLFGFRASDFSV